MLDKTDWDTNTETIGDNIMSGEDLNNRREEILKDLKDTNMLDKNLDESTKNRLDKAI
jgi:hypothetical protein